MDYAQKLAFNNWCKDGGDAAMRYNYQICQNDNVIDIGAYHGTWSREIYDRYKCMIVAFEPIKAYYEIAKARLANTKAIIHNAGVGPVEISCNISINGDASSTLNCTGDQELIRIMGIDSIMDSMPNIKLMKINIEGGEYDLLEHMLDNDLIKRIDDIQIQFHFTKDAIARREKIRDRLAKTHHLTYDYFFVWENWHINA